MDARDWALITFTILVQMSVGSIWVLGVAHYFAARKYGAEEADRLSDRALFALVPVIALAFIASLLHLGNPFNAYRAVAHLGSSWLSAEIFFGVIFAVLAFIFAFLQWRKIGSLVLRNVFAWLAALDGLVLVFVMSKFTCCHPSLPGIHGPRWFPSTQPLFCWVRWRWARRLLPITPICNASSRVARTHNARSCGRRCAG